MRSGDRADRLFEHTPEEESAAVIAALFVVQGFD